MRVRDGLVWLTFLFAGCAGAQTLRDLLATSNVPSAAFGDVELATPVMGISKSDRDRTVIAFRNGASGGAGLVGPVQVMQYDRVGDAAVRSQLQMKEGDGCGGGVEDIYFVTGFTIVGTTTSPTAGCLFVLGPDMQLTQTLKGLSPVEVATGFVVVAENVGAAGAAQSPRLQMADLQKRTVSELYPPKGDSLRVKMAHENEKHIAAKEKCADAGDGCAADNFDEDVHSVATDGKGHFAFIVDQAARNAQSTVAEQKVFYLYTLGQGSLLYCEEELKNIDVDALDDGMQTNFLRALDRCTPALPVAAETAGGGAGPS